MPPIGYGFGTQSLLAPPAESPNNNNGGWLDQVFDRVDDGFDVYNQLRCALNPTAPGCYTTGSNQQPTGASAPNNTWLYVGLAVIILLVIALVIIALKK
jgi:hypothetical protein